MIKIRDLSKRYSTVDGDVIALDGVSLTIDSGDFVAVVGRSGSGKTTLLNMIAGLDTPDTGSIKIDGDEIAGASEDTLAAWRRSRIGVIYQFYNLIPELTISENITLPAELDRRDIDNEWLSEILTAVGLDDRKNAFPTSLSGGQQQRAAIARALYNKPSLILADEPTGNLDGENSADIMSRLMALNESGITLVVVTHSDEVSKHSKRIIRLADGRVVDDTDRSTT